MDEVDGENGSNTLIIDFDSEAGDASVMGSADPVDAMEGILGSGYSGGASWIETRQGWAIVATNTWGDDSVYGSVSGLSRVSTQPAQKVHSKVQIRASALSNGRSRSQHSQLGRSSSIGASLERP